MRDSRARREPRLREISYSAPVGRPALSFGFGIAAAVALVPAFWLLAPDSRWEPAGLVIALGVIALVSYFAALVLERSQLLDSVFLVALLAVVLLGPAPAACIWIGTELVAWLVERHRLGAFGASVASYGWAALAGSLVIEVIASGWPEAPAGAVAYLAIAGAALVMLIVNFVIVVGLVIVMRDSGNVARTIKRELSSQARAILLLPLIASAAAFLYMEVGVGALIGVALIALTPQVTLPLVRRRSPMNELSHSEAVALYADAIASVMKLNGPERLVLKDAAPFMRDRRTKSFGSEVSDSSSAHRIALSETVLFSREHWDGCGGRPGALGGEMIPLTSRILAVADAWSGLTAKDSPELNHSQALLQLEARAGMHFDPRVVAAVGHLIRQERLGRLTDPAFQPRLHRARMRSVRRALRALSPLWEARDRERAAWSRHRAAGARHPLHEVPRV